MAAVAERVLRIASEQECDSEQMVVDDRVIRKKFGRQYIEISHDKEADKFAVINWLLQNSH
jgi:hypothetical protein